MPVSFSLVVTCWENANLMALLNVLFSCVFVTFPYDELGQVWYMIFAFFLTFYVIVNICDGPPIDLPHSIRFYFRQPMY